jgi:hypothetical protein
MRIYVDATGPAAEATLRDGENFGAFDVEVVGDEAAAAPTLAALGSWQPGDRHVFVTVEALVGLAGARGRNPDWRNSLQAMLDYAASHGWVDDAGRVRAHIVDPGF